MGLTGCVSDPTNLHVLNLLETHYSEKKLKVILK